jgi:hypothetical protein
LNTWMIFGEETQFNCITSLNYPQIDDTLPWLLVTEWGDRAATSTCDCILLGKPKNHFLIKTAS